MPLKIKTWLFKCFFDIQNKMASGVELEFVFEYESKFGTYTSLGRFWKAKGEVFEVKTKMGRESLYLFGAVSPASGAPFTKAYERSNTEAMNDFINDFEATRPGKFIVMLLDRAG